ncbi:carboxyl transferase domain-containing protein [Streptomyces sp. NPDC001780]
MPERLSAREAVAALAEPGTFAELPAPAGGTGGAADEAPDGPLGWPGYDAMRARARARTGEEESVVCGTARVGTTRAVLISFEFGFLGGSLGERTGDRLVAAHRHARAHGLPVVSLIATGGSRMQEGMRALLQLQRVAGESALTRARGLPQLAVVRDPTTGGGWATLGAGADVVLALPDAQIGFAGSRVRPADADPYAYTARAQFAAGQVDALVDPDELGTTVGRWLTLLAAGGGGERAASGATPLSGPADETLPPPAGLGLGGTPATGWQAVLRARSPDRPRAPAYLDAYLEQRAEITGDRCGGRDPGMLCGFGLRGGRPVAYAAQAGTATLPAGYRTAARLVRLADRLGIPVLTLVDTPGAANDAEAERSGAGAAIADLFQAVATARVPLTTLVIGEGGSGGALALSAPGNTWVTADSYFSVIAPEPATAILKRPVEEIREVAGRLRLRPQDLVDLGVVRGIVPTAGARS